MASLNCLPRRRLFPRVILALFVIGLGTAAFAGEVRMRSGMVLNGSVRKLQSLTGKPDNQANVVTYPIVMIQSGGARYFLSSRQIPEGGLNPEGNLAKFEVFSIKQARTSPKSRTFASVGQFANVDPFDKFGHRTITLSTSNKPISVHQGIVEVSPTTTKLWGLNYLWDYAISTKSIPPDVLENVLRHRTEPTDPTKRLQLARFFIQAEMFPQAFNELDAIARDFPDLKERATSVHEGLVQEFGRVLVRELKQRVEAGQHQLGEEFAKQMAANQIGGAVQKDVRDFLKQCDQRRESMAHAQELLDEFAAKLPETALREKLAPLRSVLIDELHPDSINRLDPFLKAEADNGYSVSEKLALAYSGWVLGAANAVTDLEHAIRLWDARFLAKEALRATAFNDRQRLYQQLKKVEGVGPEKVRQMIPQLPPAVETPDIEPGKPYRIEIEPADDTSLGTSYSVLLPLEYSPQHTYPLVLALRAEGRKLDHMLEWWGGTQDQPGLAQRRGYIVIAPEYATPDQGQYTYDAATHARVLSALNDARRRFPIDSDRVYLSGHGMGADAAFDLGFTHPDEFAGVIPICGVIDHYPKHYVKNGFGTAWYVIGGELDRDTAARNSPFFDLQLMKAHGYKIDFLYAEFAQRGFEHYAEEQPHIFDWMSLHRRIPLTNAKEMEMRSLRATDRRFFWVTATDLTKTVILPQPNGEKQTPSPSIIDVRITPGNGSGNVIVLNSPAKHYTLWIHPDLVDLEKKVIVKIKTQQKHNAFIDQDAAATLEDYRDRGDRQRLYAAKLEF